TRYNWLLHYALVHEINKESFSFANTGAAFELDDNLFTIEGWVPEDKIDELKALCASQDIYYEEIALHSQETPPTYLENKGVPKVGEDLVDIFDVPSHKDKDPSIWVLFAFSLFFAMIVQDAGYGLIFLATALYLRFKVKKLKDLGARFLKLVTILACFTIIWGFMM